MNLSMLYVILICNCCCRTNALPLIITSSTTTISPVTTTSPLTTTKIYSFPTAKPTTEDEQVIQETLKKYGLPIDHKKLGLPGPEIYIDDNKFSLNDKFDFRAPGNYMFRIRTLTKTFSFNGRYEEGLIGGEYPIIKGQHGEHFERKSGGYYVRTIGYVLDKYGYREFLIDLTKSVTQDIIDREIIPTQPPEKAVPVQDISYPEPGGPTIQKSSISSTVLGSLIGGNALG